jgi:peptide-methionine (S)-S-oxide reductase
MMHRSLFRSFAVALIAVLAATPTLAADAVFGQPAPPPPPGLAVAVFAGGCFWCMEGPFDEVAGVLSTTSGYAGGTKEAPTYEEVSAGWTGHAESVRVVYDPKKVTYEQLLEIYWHNVDPLTADAQFCDHGHQYRTAIFTQDEAQKAAAEASKKALDASHRFKQPIVTEITPAGKFWPAEDYHQDFYVKNPLRYRFYRAGCGRDPRLRELWGDQAGHAGH